MILKYNLDIMLCHEFMMKHVECIWYQIIYNMTDTLEFTHHIPKITGLICATTQTKIK